MLLYMLRLSEVEQSRLSVCILLQLWSRLKPVVSHLSSAFFEHQSILTVLGWIYVHVERYGVSLAEDGKVTYSGRSSRSQNQMFLSWKPWNWHCLISDPAGADHSLWWAGSASGRGSERGLPPVGRGSELGGACWGPGTPVLSDTPFSCQNTVFFS